MQECAKKRFYSCLEYLLKVKNYFGSTVFVGHASVIYLPIALFPLFIVRSTCELVDSVENLAFSLP